MRLRNVLIVVKDMERSIKFYHDLFGLDTVVDQDGNVILTEGLVLQDEKLWKKFLGREVIPENNSCELYFEEREFDCFVEKLERLYPEVQYVNLSLIHISPLSTWKVTKYFVEDVSVKPWAPETSPALAWR